MFLPISHFLLLPLLLQSDMQISKEEVHTPHSTIQYYCHPIRKP